MLLIVVAAVVFLGLEIITPGCFTAGRRLPAACTPAPEWKEQVPQ